jgi:hypothetical protein
MLETTLMTKQWKRMKRRTRVTFFICTVLIVIICIACLIISLAAEAYKKEFDKLTHKFEFAKEDQMKALKDASTLFDFVGGGATNIAKHQLTGSRMRLLRKGSSSIELVLDVMPFISILKTCQEARLLKYFL